MARPTGWWASSTAATAVHSVSGRCCRHRRDLLRAPMSRACKNAKVPHYHPHDLRHRGSRSGTSRASLRASSPSAPVTRGRRCRSTSTRTSCRRTRSHPSGSVPCSRTRGGEQMKRVRSEVWTTLLGMPPSNVRTLLPSEHHGGSGLVLGGEVGGEMAAYEGSCNERERSRNTAPLRNADLH
jgi:hypothetical protein